MKYTDANAQSWDILSKQQYIWTVPISHEEFLEAQKGNYSIYLTPSKSVPNEWFPNLKRAKVLGLASGGGQQGPIFVAQGAVVTIFDLSDNQLLTEKSVAEREGYDINVIKGDMTESFPFANESFDLIFHPVANCYVENIQHIWNECYRVMKKNGILMTGFLTETGFLFDFNQLMKVVNKMPVNPLKGLSEAEIKIKHDNQEGFMFSHTLEEQIGGQIKAGLTLTDIYDDRDRVGVLAEYMNIYAFTRAVKK
jgi:SAM-dependent methyltransferase